MPVIGLEERGTSRPQQLRSKQQHRIFSYATPHMNVLRAGTFRAPVAIDFCPYCLTTLTVPAFAS
jgi:hypothetical protein